ncbi:hypothetical protein OPT61_g3858 [Boeremia exigua]|uniref:Uncharacterized protein n=1 Tax=Boeremia exigua TaxID=749465 RepID=A0ACC2IGD4_9PLEO|nr:hypothetical protein OPT61_g3858 [Boeremia exigua]
MAACSPNACPAATAADSESPPEPFLEPSRKHRRTEKSRVGAAYPHSCSVATGTPGPASAPRVSIVTGGGLSEEQDRYDQLRIPSSQTTPDAILAWPVFQHRWPENLITDPLFEAELSDRETEEPLSHLDASLQVGSVNEEQVPALIQNFLRHVHIKNPVVDAEMLISHAHQISKEGVKWDAASCLVILACALGCVAKPFHVDISDSPYISIKRDNNALRNGETYFACARMRFGLLKAGTTTTQCHFLAGVYLMYTMRPLSAWMQFRSASESYHLYLDFQKSRQGRPTAVPLTIKQRSLEQGLYWSCYKSECEFRKEMNFPDSCLVDVRYRDLHPLPPRTDAAGPVSNESIAGRDFSLSTGKALNMQEQENSWFYYLTEITLRRICNSVLNVLYTLDYKEWTDERVSYMVRAATEFEQQLQDWYNGLPSPLQYEKNKTPSEELPCFSVIEAMPTRHRHHGSWYAIRFNISASFLILAAVESGSLPIRSDWRSLLSYNVERLSYWEAEAPGVLEALRVMRAYF